MNIWLSLAASVAIAATMTACGGDDDGNVGAGSSSSTTNEISFKSIATPTTNNEQNALQATDEVTVDGVKQNIGFSKLMHTTQSDNGEVYGLLKDMNDNILTMNDGNPYICNGTSNPDGSGSGLDYFSIIQKNNKLFMVSQFECQIGAFYINELNQNTTTGELSLKPNTLKYISQKDEFGGYVHCAGMKTPWESHLGSEEYEPNARKLNADGTLDDYYNHISAYWGGDITKANPYYYGWTPEVTIDSSSNANYTKHYSMGRMSHELSYVMPDEKTVYLSDDGTNVGLFMYIADRARDLSAGTLYAAKWTQTSSANGGSADISWIELGHATDSEIRAMLDPDGNVATNDGLKFTDIFDTEDGDSTTGTCSTGFTSINTSAGFECLKIKSGKEKAATYLETRRYAAIKGATTEFRKEEGITFDKNSNTLYVGMSSIGKGMEDNMKYAEANDKYDIGGNNHIKLPYNYCGAVYALDVSLDATVGSSYVAKNMYAVVTGTPIAEDADGNKCHLDAISNPDNIAFLDGSNILTIGEDTSKHINNVIWNFNVDTKELTRILTTPLGAETTSPFWYRDINGFGYMSAVTQHPDETTDDSGQSSAGVLGAIKNLK
ncbi:MAG: DUF839 domain-containing protein [Campylobacterota bacterium]|nr:DUF839 domain-containing protein [Campylobacterota bacterium]